MADVFKVYQVGDSYVVSCTGSAKGYAAKFTPGHGNVMRDGNYNVMTDPLADAEAYCRAANKGVQ